MPPKRGPRAKLTEELAVLIDGARLAAGLDYRQLAAQTNKWIRDRGLSLTDVDHEDVSRICRFEVKSSAVLLAVMGALGVDESRSIAVLEPVTAAIARRLLAVRKADLERFGVLEARFSALLDAVEDEIAARERTKKALGVATPARE